jgi:hypothetical protein
MFFSIFGRYIRRYWWLAVVFVLGWKLLEHWALTKADEYLGPRVGGAVQSVSAFLHVDAGSVVLVLVFVAIGAATAFDARRTAPTDRSRNGRASTSEQVKTYEIRFDYLPGNLLDNGWVRAYPKDADVRPKATLIPDAPIAGSILIDSPEGHAYDFPVQRSVKLSDRLVFVAKYSATTMIFATLELSSVDGTQAVYKSIKFELGKGLPHPTKGWEEYEYTLPVNGEPIINDWRRFDIALPEAVAQTWGKHGMILKGVTKFRLRGSLSISPIEFYESR